MLLVLMYNKYYRCNIHTFIQIIYIQIIYIIHLISLC